MHYLTITPPPPHPTPKKTVIAEWTNIKFNKHARK